MLKHLEQRFNNGEGAFVSRDIKMRGIGSVFSGKIHTKAEKHCGKKKEYPRTFYVCSYEENSCIESNEQETN